MGINKTLSALSSLLLASIIAQPTAKADLISPSITGLPFELEVGIGIVIIVVAILAIRHIRG